MTSKAKLEELFGSDSDDDDDEAGPAAAEEDDAPPQASAAADGDDEDVGDLFGSDEEDDDQEDGGGGGALAQAEPSAEPIDFALPLQPRPAAESKLYLMRLPNILKLQPRPYDAETYNEGDDAEAGEGGEEGRRVAANVIRWRETPTGGRQSNARLVKWSDGSMTLHVGSEALKAAAVAIMPQGSTHLYSQHQAGNLECHGIVPDKITIAPMDRKSSTHLALAKEVARQHGVKMKPKMQMVSTVENPEKKKKADELAWEESQRLQARQAARKQRDGDAVDAPNLTTDFLDADDDGPLEGNIGALKRGFKARKKGGGGGGGAKGGARRRPAVGGSYALGGKRPRTGLASRRGGSDDDDDYDDDEEEEEEEDDEGEPGEMDGFIVGDGDDDDGGGSEEEAVMSDEDDDEEEKEERPKKKKKAKKKARLVDEDEDSDD